MKASKKKLQIWRYMGSIIDLILRKLTINIVVFNTKLFSECSYWYSIYDTAEFELSNKQQNKVKEEILMMLKGIWSKNLLINLWRNN